MVSLPLEKVIGLPFNTFIPGESKEQFDKLVEYAWKKDRKEEMGLLNHNNQVIHCLLSCNTLELDEGTALSLILTDLTILKETESLLKIKNEQLEAAHTAAEKLNTQLEDTVKERTNELFLSREHFKFLANNIPQMTWTNQPNGDVDYFNQQWYAYTGLSADESKKQGWQKAVHPDDLATTVEKYTAAIKSGNIFEVENRYRKGSDGSYRWHLNRAIPLRNENGEVVFWVGTATDIEDQKREMEKKDEFIGIASHELKPPLTSLKGYLQLISNYKKEEIPAVVKQYIAKANIALNKLQRLINDLLDVSKIQAGRLEYSLENIDICDLIKTCIEENTHIYPSYNFVNEAQTECIVKGNAERLEQVLMNLINNAVKYSQESRTVIIKTMKLDKYLRVSVTDFGIGLSHEQRKRIFERFYRVEDKKNMTSGLGMGLYISAEIIRNHNGTIGVDGELGKGATFYFELPLAGENEIKN